MIIKMDAKYVKGQVAVSKLYYNNGRIALELLDPDDGEIQATATVNVPEFPLKDGYVLLKGWSENEGIPEALEKAGVVRLTKHTVQTGFVKAQVAKLLVQLQQGNNQAHRGSLADEH